VTGMFERFSDRARRVVVQAQQEARERGHGYLGPEHLLLGLVRDGNGLAARVLDALGVSREAVRQRVDEAVPRGELSPTGHIPFTPAAKKLLEQSLLESRALGHDYIGSEHILLALLGAGGGVAAQVLTGLGAGLDEARGHTTRILEEYRRRHDGQAG